MNKRILSLLLALVFVFAIAAGCANDETTKAPEGGDTTTKAPDGGDTTEPQGDPVELLWIMGDPGKVPADQAIVEERLNEISVPLLNVKVRTLYYDNERTMLALSTGEEYDMVFTCEWFNNYAVQANAGYFADLTDIIQTETPDLYASMPEVVWDGTRVNNKIFAIPVKKDYAAELFWRFDKELFVDELGFEIEWDMDFHDIEEYLAAAKEAYDSGVEAASNAEYPLKLTKGGLGGLDAGYDMINRDAMLGIPYHAVGSADEDKIIISVEDSELYDRLVALHEWYKAGYVNQDAATVDDVGSYSAIKSGQGFYGADAIWTGADGYPQVISRFSGPYLSTASIRGSLNAISANSENIELALKYQELVNLNQEYRDILRYGVEETHWTKTAEGLAQRTEQGRNNYNPWPFSQGSYSLSTVEAAEGVEVDPDMWNVIFEGYADALATKSIGFSFDISPVEAEIAVCKVIRDKYWVGLITGSLDPAVEIPKMMAELEDAGIRDIQAEAQRQFDEWLGK